MSDHHDKLFLHRAFLRKYPHITRVLHTEAWVRASAATNPVLGEPADSAGMRKLLAIWDTGATNSVVSEELVNELELQPTGKILVRGVGGADERYTYIVDIALPNKLLIPQIQVTEGSINDPQTDVHLLIGMDIISLGDFLITNSGGRTHFSFCIPAFSNRDCLLEKSEKVNKRIITKNRGKHNIF